MGKINWIWNPKDWKIVNEEKNENVSDDIIYEMVIGIGNDQGYCEILDFISKTNYENIMLKRYSVKSFPYSSNHVLLFDENNNLIPMVMGQSINIDELDESQKNLIKHPQKIKTK